jgi:hypothetical protein
LGKALGSNKVRWYPYVAIWKMMRLVVLFTVKEVAGGNAVSLIDDGKEATFGNLSVAATYTLPGGRKECPHRPLKAINLVGIHLGENTKECGAGRNVENNSPH